MYYLLSGKSPFAEVMLCVHLSELKIRAINGVFIEDVISQVSKSGDVVFTKKL